MSGASLAGGIALAAIAAACFDGAVALQAVAARELETAPAVGRGLVAGLLRSRRWLAATGLAIFGWPFQVAALALAPLTVVQPTLALGLVLLLWLGHRLLGEPAGRRELVAVGAIVAGVAVLAWAAPEPSHVHARALTLAIVLGALGAAATLPWVLRRSIAGGLLVFAAGAGYAASGVTSKLLADELSAGRWGATLAWGGCTLAVAGLALGDEMAALQRVRAVHVATGAFVLQTVVPVLFAPLLVGETWSHAPLGGVPIAAGLLLVAVGSIVLASAPAVRGLLTDGR